MTLVFALEAAFSKLLQVTCFPAPLYVQVKERFEAITPKLSSEINVLCNNSNQTCFSDTLTSERLGFQNLAIGPADVNAAIENHV